MSCNSSRLPLHESTDFCGSESSYESEYVQILSSDSNSDSECFTERPDDSEIKNSSTNIADLVNFEGQAQQFDPDVSDAKTNPESNKDALFDGNLHSVEYYRQGVEMLDEVDYERKEYSPGTEALIAVSENQWREYCIRILQKDWLYSYHHLSLSTVYHFLEWHLNQRTGKDGRLRPGLKKKSSLITFWCTFRLAFERNTFLKIDKLIDRRKMHNALVELGNRYGLTNDKRENRSMSLADLKLQIQSTLSTTEKAFKLGELRILAVLFLLLLAPAGSRPGSIVKLRFGDIRLVLVRDPKNGPHRLLIKFTLNFTKRYLGSKAAKTFLIPEIIYEPSLLLSPHIFLLGILFRHRAFRSESLNDSPRTLADLDIHPDDYELPIPLKESLDDVYIFRQAEQGLMGWTMSKKPLTQGAITAWVKRIGELIGFEHTTICYSLRYMAGNNMDRSVNVSEALRNLVMEHAPNSKTFDKHYLNRHVCVDLWAIHLSHEPQQALIEQAASHGHSRSARRPVHLTEKQSASINEDPQVLRMEAKLRDLPIRSQEHREARLKIKAFKAKLFKTKKDNIREAWTANQAVEDIERQIQGTGFAPIENSRPRAQPMTPAQQQLMDALTAPLITDIKAQFLRRAEAIDAIVAYCKVEEPLSTKVLENRRAPLPSELMVLTMIQASSPGSSQVPVLIKDTEQAGQLRQSVSIHAAGEKPTRCFICIAKALTLLPNDPNVRALCRQFLAARALTRHFRKVHLSKVKKDTKTKCPVCVPVVSLMNKMHLQNHAELVHGICS